MSKADIGVVGIGVMGGNLARNLESRGATVALLDRDPETPRAFAARHAGRWVACASPAELVASLTRPRRILMMVNAGPAVDAVLGALGPHLEVGDIAVDGGNSHWEDTDRRLAAGAEAGWRFVGLGVSGGARGALEGPSMMPGGDPEAYRALEPLLTSIAARSELGACVTWCGHGSAGHFTKMVHNGIEYGDMQLLAETWTLLREGLGLDPVATGEVFARWNAGSLESFLVEITSRIVAAPDPEGDGVLVDQVLDVAGQKGTGRWTSVAALTAGVPLPTVTAAVDARVLSAMKGLRGEVEGALGRAGGRVSGVTVDDLEAALYAAKLVSYTQGFHLLRTASAERGYATDLAEVARIWTAGCIIRAGFLEEVVAAFREAPDLASLLLAPRFTAAVRERLPALRRVVVGAMQAGLPVPGLAASLSYLDTLARHEGSASLIQAQRDWFGSHTYRRKSAPDTPVHTDWEALG